MSDLRELLGDWRRHLYAVNLSPRTIRTYVEAGLHFRDFMEASDHGALDKRTLEAYLAAFITRPNKRTGAPVSPAYVVKHYRSLQAFFKWLHAEELIEETLLAG